MVKSYITDWMQRFTSVIIDPEPSTEAKEFLPKPTFYPFPRLPAEVRVNIWAIALQDQYKERPCDEDLDWMFDWVLNSVTLFMNHSGFYVITSRGYPTHFFVNREARAEAARCDGGIWLPLGEGDVKVYINFEKEDVRLHDSCTAYLEASLLHTRAWPILEKEARCRDVYDASRGVYGAMGAYSERFVASHWVGRKRAGETT